MAEPEAHEIELDSLDREAMRVLVERDRATCVALALELRSDLRLIDRAVMKLLHNGLVTVDADDVCTITRKGRERVPSASSGSFRQKLNRIC